MFSPKSSEFRSSPKVPPSPPPAYRPSPMAPVFVTETRTRTEVVTTTTTETTTHLFSMPYWRKRTGSQPIPSRGPSLEINTSKPLMPSTSRPLLIDKALPPTPPDDGRDLKHTTSGEILSPSSPLLLSTRRISRDRNVSGGMQSASVLAQAALGLGLPHASPAIPHRETNSVTFVSLPTPSSSSLTSLAEPPLRQVRRVKSSQRIESSPEAATISDALAQRRRRGFSFGATSFLGLSSADQKAKEGEAEKPQPTIKSPPKPLSRKSSFWRKRSSSAKEIPPPTPPPDNQVLSVPALPPVNHVSPFGVEFPSSPLPGVKSFPAEPGSHGDNFSQPPSSSSSTNASPRPSLTFANPPQPSHDPPPVPVPRLRTQTNSPLLHRLSLAVFSSPEPSPTPSLLRSMPSSNILNQLASPAQKKPDALIPKPLGDDESPEIYLERLKSEVSKAEVAGILASSSDPFYSRALQAYFNQFEFTSLPLDVALRKLLMEVGLPRETQQIDRVMEAFASRYRLCNPNLFTSDDHPYILAFSLIMLHTDAFNPSNKRKMTKADYIKNTKLPGIPTEVLDCFFDNIVFAPFIFIEDPVDCNGQPGLSPEVARSVSSPTSALPTPSSATPFKMGNRVDPYYIIMNNLLDPLRTDVAAHIPLENPFSYEGTNGPWDESGLHDAFMKASVIEVDIPSFPRSPTMFNLGGSPNVAMSPLPDVSHFVRQTWSLKITKIGLLNRKDDLLEGGKKAMNRKWRTWSVILTGSQLLFCRDPTWASTLLPRKDDSNHPVVPTNFRPDELFSLKDALAVYDRSYSKYQNVFRFALPDGRHLLLQASDDAEMNQWISRINYASAFKSAGVRMRPLALSGEDIHLTGVAAATSHLHDLQTRTAGARPLSWGSDAHNDLMDMLTSQPAPRPQLKRRVTMGGRLGLYDNESAVSPEVDGAEQFKATFDQVKAVLAANSSSADEEMRYLAEQAMFESPPSSPKSFTSATSSSRLPSRSQIILSKIQDLDTRLAALRTQLDSDERFARSIAILTPFRKTTRSRLLASIQSMNRAVMQVRLEVEKLKCHRSVLRSDLVSEGKVWSQSKRVALRAAKDTLLTRRPKTAPQKSPTSPYKSSPASSPSLPPSTPTVSPGPLSITPRLGISPVSNPNTHRLTDSEEITRHLLRSPTSPSTWSRTTRGRTTSTSGSFYSAQENPSFLEWPSSPVEEINSPMMSPKLSSPSASLPILHVGQNESTSSILIHPSAHEGDTSILTPYTPEPSRLMSLPLPPGSSSSVQESSADESSPEEEEQAEDWNKTRVAKRVSLIQVPSDIAIAKRMKAVAEPIIDDE